MFNAKKKQKNFRGKFLTFENLHWSGTNPHGHYRWPLHKSTVSPGCAVSCALCHIILKDLYHQPTLCTPVCRLPGRLLTPSPLNCLSRYMVKRNMQAAKRSSKPASAFQVTNFLDAQEPSSSLLSSGKQKSFSPMYNVPHWLGFPPVSKSSQRASHLQHGSWGTRLALSHWTMFIQWRNGSEEQTG